MPDDPPDVLTSRNRRWGLAIAAAFVVTAVPVGLMVTVVLVPEYPQVAYPQDYPYYNYSGYHSARLAFYWGAVWCTLVALAGLGGGLHLCCLSEFRRTGVLARRLLKAEQLHLRARRSLAGWLLWGAVFAGGVALLLGWVTSSTGSGSFRSFNAFMPAIMLTLLGASLIVPAAVAFNAAFGLSSSRRRGGAVEILQTPQAAESLAWAVVRTHQSRGLWMLGATAPVVASVALMLMFNLSDDSPYAPLLITLLMLATATVLGYWGIRIASAIGTWLGSAVGLPVLAGILGTLAALAAWVLGAVLVGFTVATVVEVSPRSALQGYASFSALFLPAVWAMGVLISALCLWLARRSLTTPLALRSGAWLAGAGELLLNLCGETAARDRSLLPEHLRFWQTSGRVAWRLPLFGLAAFGAAVVLSFVIAGDAASGNDALSKGYSLFFLAMLGVSVASGAVVAAWALFRRHLRRWRGREAVRSPKEAVQSTNSVHLTAPTRLMSPLQWAGLVIAVAGVPLALIIALIVVPWLGPLVWRLDDAMECVIRVSVIAFLAHLAAGLAMLCLPTFRKRGPAAARLLDAEKNFPRRLSFVLSAAIGVGVFAFGMLLVIPMFGLLPWCREYLDAFTALATLAFLACSLTISLRSAIAAALRAVRSRLDGPAASVLVSGSIADLLPWAAFRASTAGVVSKLAACSPLYFAMVMALTGRPLLEMHETYFLLTVALLSAGIMLAEYLCHSAAVALGGWTGWAVPVPGLAGVLAAGGALALWTLRFFALGLCIALAEKGPVKNRAAEILLLCGAFCAAWTTVILPIQAWALWASRNSLAAPLMSRFGAWLVRRGETLMGMPAVANRWGARPAASTATAGRSAT